MTAYGTSLQISIWPQVSVARVLADFLSPATREPWPKKRHASHRLVSPWFAREVERTCVPGGRITLATDHPPYRDQMIEVLESHGGFENLRGPGAYGDRIEGFTETIFERRWLLRGKNVFYIQFRRGEEP